MSLLIGDRCLQADVDIEVIAKFNCYFFMFYFKNILSIMHKGFAWDALNVQYAFAATDYFNNTFFFVKARLQCKLTGYICRHVVLLKFQRFTRIHLLLLFLR